MSAPLFVIKRGATLLRSAIAGSTFSTNSCCLCNNPRGLSKLDTLLMARRMEALYSKPRGLSKFDTLLMARRMEAQSKLRPELKSDQVDMMSIKSRADFHADQIRAELKEIQKTVRDGCIATGLVLVYFLGLAVSDTQMKHKKS